MYYTMYSVSIYSLKLVKMKNKDLVKQLNSTSKVTRSKISEQSILCVLFISVNRKAHIYSQDYIYV